MDDLKIKNKSLFIVKTYDYFQTVFTFLFGSAVANISTAVSASDVVGAAADAVTVGSFSCYWFSSFWNSDLTILEKLG